MGAAWSGGSQSMWTRPAWWREVVPRMRSLGEKRGRECDRVRHDLRGPPATTARLLCPREALSCCGSKIFSLVPDSEPLPQSLYMRCSTAMLRCIEIGPFVALPESNAATKQKQETAVSTPVRDLQTRV